MKDGGLAAQPPRVDSPPTALQLRAQSARGGALCTTGGLDVVARSSTTELGD
jgi:hypothetical protein